MIITKGAGAAYGAVNWTYIVGGNGDRAPKAVVLIRRCHVVILRPGCGNE